MTIHLICAIPLTTCLILSARGQTVVPEKQLLIIDPEVVDSSATVYPEFLSVGHLFDELAPDGSGSDLARNWLELWMQDLEVNGSPVAARPRIQELVIEPWRRRDGWDAARDGEWRPNFANAPFRLLAVVNRIDLSTPARAAQWGGGRQQNGSFPQGRLVYAVLGEDGEPLGQHFTVIFEYELPIEAGKLGPYARSWGKLGALRLGSPDFLTQLQAVVSQFTDHSRDEKWNRIRPPLAQVRTNDMALDEICELREFKLAKGGRELRPALLPHTPATKFARNGGRFNRILGEFIEQNSEAIKEGKKFPLSLEAPTGSKRLRVLAGSALIPDKGFHWNSNRIRDAETRHQFSKRTCNGCHSADTGTNFCHISPRREGEAAVISDFLRFSEEPLVIDNPSDRNLKVRSNEMRRRISSFKSALKSKG